MEIASPHSPGIAHVQPIARCSPPRQTLHQGIYLVIMAARKSQQLCGKFLQPTRLPRKMNGSTSEQVCLRDHT
jgi:hypothetical protein